MVESTRDDPHVFDVAPLAFHRMRLAAPGLAIRENGPVEPAQHGLNE